MKKKGLIISIVSIFTVAVLAAAGIWYFTATYKANDFAEKEVFVCIDQAGKIELSGNLSGLSYESDNPGIVSVDENGNYTATQSGTAHITVSKWPFSFEKTICVNEHSFTQPDCVNDAVCSKCGTKGEPALGHLCIDATCTDASYCERCGEQFGEPLGHIGVKPGCLEPGICERCKKEIEPALGHDFMPATCTENSYCSRCGEEGEEKAFGHNFLKATCVLPSTCEYCGETEGEPLGHTKPKKYKCDEPVFCTVCNEKISDAPGHDFTKATCTEPKTCKHCGATEGEALGHTCVEATCERPSYCIRCEKTFGSALPHTFVESQEGNLFKMTCAVCGLQYVEFRYTQDLLNQYINEAYAALNADRVANNLPPLAVNATLQRVATKRAQEVSVLFSHTRPDGSSCFTAFDEFGASYGFAGENIASGYMSAEDVELAWMNSPGHRENILRPEFRQVGIGIYSDGNVLHWVQNFSD